MTEQIIPDVEMTSDVPESAGTLAEIIRLFEDLMSNEERMKMHKEAEALKTAFYKKLSADKAAAGVAEEIVSEVENQAETLTNNPFVELESGFKELYNKFKQERAEYNRQLEAEKEENLSKKMALIEDLKHLLEKQDDVNTSFPEFKEIQKSWREIGPVPVQSFRNINETYQLYVEQFYDMVQIDRDLRDLDFKINLEAKEKLCEEAEKLAAMADVLEAFRELQRLHDAWKEYGPVAKEFRESIWERFKAATTIINKKHQTHFDELKVQQEENLQKKSELCAKVEELAEKEYANSNEWNASAKEIEDIQKVWRTIGYASKKDNQKVYDRFRAACDKFYTRKREFYSDYKDSINSNLQKKIEICEKAEALKTSTEWKKTTDQLIALQAQWKEIGAVPRKKAEQLWTRFRAACDEFFAERDKHSKLGNDFYRNLKAKNHLIEEIKAYQSVGQEEDLAAMREFMARWQEIGFVPFKEKDKLAAAYKEALHTAFPNVSSRARRAHGNTRSEKDRLIQKYHKLEQDIVTYENNIGFFALSKNSAPLIKQMEDRIEKAKKELQELASEIQSLEKTTEE